MTILHCPHFQSDDFLMSMMPPYDWMVSVVRGYCWGKVEYLPLIGFFIGVAALYPRVLGSLAYVSWEDGPPNTTQEPFFI